MYNIDLPPLQLLGIEANMLSTPSSIIALCLADKNTHIALTRLVKNDRINVQNPRGQKLNYRVSSADIIMNGNIDIRQSANDCAKALIALIAPYPHGRRLMGRSLHYVVYARCVNA